jgi:hypothetical protein
MCYYCRYLAHEKSISYDDRQYFSEDVKYYSIRSRHLITLLRLIGITIFFVMLNITIVLAQSSKLLERNSQGKKKKREFNI